MRGKKKSEAKPIVGLVEANISKKKALVESVRSLIRSGHLAANFDIEGLVRALEASEILYREMRTLYEAFGIAIDSEKQSKVIYATHLKKLMADHGCLAKGY